MGQPEAFVHLRTATLRGTRTCHRLTHLGREPGTGDQVPRLRYELADATLTDLLLAELSGLDHQIAGTCPDCPPGRTGCEHWTGRAHRGHPGPLVRPLVRVRERAPDHHSVADFAISFYNSTVLGLSPGIRLLVRATRARPGRPVLTGRTQRTQLDRLRSAADDLGAVPYHALYVQHPDAHRVAATRCDRPGAAAADTAVVLTPALRTDPGDGRHGLLAEDLIGAGRPLPCLTGCRCCGSQDERHSFDTALAFVHQDLPDYRPLGHLPDLPVGPASVAVDDGRCAITPDPGTGRIRRDTSGREREILIVRLGPGRDGPEVHAPGGVAPAQDPAQIREAASRWWVLAERRILAVHHVVATLRDEVVGVYRICPDGPIRERFSPGRVRWDLRLQEMPDGTLARRLRERARAAIADLPPGTRSPVLYA